MRFELIAAAIGDRGFALYATTEVSGFLDELDSSDSDKVLGLIEHVSKEGPPSNREKSKKLIDDIFELKSYQVRIAYIYGSRRRTILMLHAIRKKSDDWPKGDMKTAKRLRSEALHAIEEGTIEYGE